MTEYFQTLKAYSLRAPTTLLNILQTSTVRDVLPLPTPTIVSVPSTATVGEAAEILYSNNIHGAPIWDVNRQNYGPFVESSDILHYLISCFLGKDHKGLLQREEIVIEDKEWRTYAGDAASMTFKSNIYVNQNVTSILAPFRTDASPIRADAPLVDLLFKLINGKRCTVFDNQWYGIVSQYDVIKFLAKSLVRCTHKDRAQNLEELKLGTQWKYDLIVKCNPDTMAINAFYKMHLKQVPCVPIVSDSKSLIANLSVTDVLNVTQQNFRTLLDPLNTWIPRNIPDPVIPPVTIHPNMTLENTLLLFASTGLHHFWITGSVGEVYRVVSLGDVIFRMYEMLESARPRGMTT